MLRWRLCGSDADDRDESTRQGADAVRIGILTNEYPPHVYGGAGVHVEYLARELAALDHGRHSVDVLCFGEQRDADGHAARRRSAPARDAAVRRSPACEALRDNAAGPGHERQARVRRHRPLPYLVHPPRRLHRQVPPGRAAGVDDALAGAAPAVEGRAARDRVPGVHLDRAHGVSECRRRDRGVGGDEAGCARALRRRRGAHPRDSQRHRSGPVPADAQRRDAARVRRSTRTCRTCCSSAGLRGRRGSFTSSTRFGISRRAFRSCSAPAHPTRPRSRRR